MKTSENSNEKIDPFSELIGNDDRFLQVIEDAKRAAQTDFNVLIFGETGTGKSLIANGIHIASNRRDARFISIDLGLLPQETQDAELFGYDPGAFTGASKKGREGLVAESNGGTLFFDEVGDASIATQSKLLRLLQERTIRKMGSNKETALDIRIIAATNQNMKRMMQDGEFRADLYYRLKVIVINIPPLIARGRRDFDLLIDHFLQKHSSSERDVTLDTGARDFLWEYPLRWPGNVRELEATIQRLIALSGSNKITRKTAEQIIQRQVTPDERQLIEGKKQKRETLQDAREIAEKKQLQEVLRKYSGNRKKAADELEKSTRTLSRLIKKYQID